MTEITIYGRKGEGGGQMGAEKKNLSGYVIFPFRQPLAKDGPQPRAFETPNIVTSADLGKHCSTVVTYSMP
jgi:hypothetical protein